MLALLVSCAGIASAQRAPAAGRSGAILSGVAVDSIRGGYLRGAAIFISGTSLSATTDSLGRFKFDRIPAGERVIQVQHPLLDSLGLTLTTTRQIFRDGDSSFVMVSIPSARTYAESSCTAEQRARGPAIVVGSVTDASPEKTSGGAAVDVTWTDFEIGKKSIKSIPQKRSAAVSPSGLFRICGLPDDLVASIVASRGKDSTATVEIDLRKEVVTVALSLPSSSATSFISGRVVDAQGKAAAGARVSVESDTAAIVAGSDGTFTLRGLRSGTRRLTVRKIGFEPLERSVDVPADGLTGAVFPLGRPVAVLKKMVVTAVRDFGLQRVGFSERKTRRPGAFFTPKDIESRNGPSIKDLLRSVPMMRRPGCTRYFVDGFLQPLGDPDEYLSGAEIGAVEVYDSQFSPPEFYAFTRGGGTCKSVVIWTKWKIDWRR
jgi:hypothetical protein